MIDRARPMTCADVRQWLSSSTADEDRALEVGEHLDTCETCRAYAEAVEPLTGDLPDAIEPPPEVLDGVFERIEAGRQTRVDFRPAAPPAGRRDLSYLASLVVAAAAVVLLFVVIRPRGPIPDDEPSIGVSTGAVAAMEQECRGAMHDLLADPVPQDNRDAAALHAQLQEVDLAIAATQRVIEQEGDEPKMVSSLARLCRVRLKLTERAQELARS